MDAIKYLLSFSLATKKLTYYGRRQFKLFKKSTRNKSCDNLFVKIKPGSFANLTVEDFKVVDWIVMAVWLDKFCEPFIVKFPKIKELFDWLKTKPSQVLLKWPPPPVQP